MGCGSSTQAAAPAAPVVTPRKDAPPSKPAAAPGDTQPQAPAALTQAAPATSPSPAPPAPPPPAVPAPAAPEASTSAPAPAASAEDSNAALKAAVIQALKAGRSAAPGEAPNLVAQAITSHPTATILDLRNCALVPDDGAAVGAGIALASTSSRNGCGPALALRRLDISGNDIGSEEDEAFDAIASALKADPDLAELDLSSTCIGRKGANIIAMCIAANRTLTRLVLSGNLGVGDEGASVLGAGISANSALTDLVMASSDIGDEGAAFFAAALQSNATIASLDLSGNTIGEEGMRELAQAVLHHVALSSLDLSGNPSIGDAGLAHIVGILGDPNCGLRQLSLSKCSITDEGAQVLAEALTASPDGSLQVLDLSGNPAIGEAGKTALQAAVQDGRVQLVL